MQIKNYLQKYGDYTFEEKPFCEIDGVVLATLAYIPYESRKKEDILNLPLCKITDKIDVLSNSHYERSFGKNINTLWSIVSKFKRFSNLELVNYVVDTNPTIEKQFGAVTYCINSDAFVCFRGSDLTINSWKENFRLSYDAIIPAQLDAVAYLNSLSREYKKVIVCGHSKGANLTIYSCLNCINKERISDIYFYDGPGLDDKSINSDNWLEIKPKLHPFMPQQSIISMVYGHGIDFNVIKSDGLVMQQHDFLRWHIRDDKFVRANSIALSSKLVYNFFHELKYTLSNEEIELFLNSVFRATENMEISRLDDFLKDPVTKLKKYKISKNELTEEEKKLYKKVKKIFINGTKEFSQLQLNIRTYKTKKNLKKHRRNSFKQLKANILEHSHIPNIRVCKAFEILSKNHGNDIAITDGEKSITRKQLISLFYSYAKGLEKCGFTKNSLIAIKMPNCIETIAMFFAINKIHANCAILDNDLTDENLAEELDILKADYLISDTCDIENIVYGKINTTIQNQNKIYDKLILYTSGSTGKKKRMMFSNDNILYAMLYFGSTGAKLYDPALHNSLSIVPFMYPYGFICSAIFPLIGGCHIILAKNLDSENLTKYFNSKLNLAYFVPSILKMVVNNLSDDCDLSGLTTVFSGGDILTEKDNIKIKEFLKNHNAKNIEIYNSCGNGEILGCATTSYGCDYRPDTVGKIVPGVRGIIVSKKNEQIDSHKIGMLAVNGKQIFEGYYADAESTNKCLIYINKKKYYLTGIMGYFDENDYFIIVGRDRRYFITQSKNGVPKKVYCEHVSDCINQITFVDKCCVSSAEIDGVYVGIAFIVLKEQFKNNEDVINSLKTNLNKLLSKKNNSLNDYEIPKRYVFIDNIPCTKAHKTDYEKMQQMAQDMFESKDK